MSTLTGRPSTSHTILRPSEPPVPYPLTKRLFDKTAAAVLVVALSPLLLLALLLIAGDKLLVARDRGRWFYRERRISRGLEFDVIKFRVLREEVLAAAAAKGEYARLHEANTDNLTAAGRVIKRIYADELPQLFNILGNDMSLVGPRPWPISMVEKQVADGLDYRLRIIAGWTGPAQVRKDSKAKSKATELDLEYVELCKTLSGAAIVRHDVRVLWHSLRTVLRGRGLKY